MVIGSPPYLLAACRRALSRQIAATEGVDVDTRTMTGARVRALRAFTDIIYTASDCLDPTLRIFIRAVPENDPIYSRRLMGVYTFTKGILNTQNSVFDYRGHLLLCGKPANNGIFIKEVGRLLSQFSPLNVSNLSTLSQQHPEITEF